MTVLCFGEILWDSLPAGLFPGGAPFNVGYHLHKLGADVRIVSAVGRDKLGDEILRRIRGWDLSTELIAVNNGLPTGTVIAEVCGSGDAHYTITTSVAWDQIIASDNAVQAAFAARALVHGSLALRSTLNCASLDRLCAVMPAEAWRVFDVNLRPPHDDLELVRARANGASLLKLNCDEAARLTRGESAAPPDEEESMARALAEAHCCPRVCITSGSRGAGMLVEGSWYWEPARTVAVVDTVGAGDAFLARLLSELLAANKTPAEALASACRHGEWVASQSGATPTY
ncbi:MAG TPA: PfkB family carbohydrate kinase [Opitutaceae bacterium]|nr:PfkB family carbohydrate kinase [Opitutaceae bacterium]